MRALGLFLDSGIPAMTLGLAASEWVILMLSIAIWRWRGAQ